MAFEEGLPGLLIMLDLLPDAVRLLLTPSSAGGQAICVFGEPTPNCCVHRSTAAAGRYNTSWGLLGLSRASAFLKPKISPVVASYEVTRPLTQRAPRCPALPIDRRSSRGAWSRGAGIDSPPHCQQGLSAPEDLPLGLAGGACGQGGGGAAGGADVRSCACGGEGPGTPACTLVTGTGPATRPGRCEEAR